MNTALTVFIAALLVSFVPGLEQPGNAPRVALLLLGAPALWAVRAGRRAVAPSRVVVAVTGVVLGMGLVGLMLVPGAERAAVAFELAVLTALLGLALLGSTLDDEQLAAMATGAACGLAIVAPLGLIQAWAGWDAALFAQARPPAATFVNRNVAAEAMVVAVPLALWAGLRARAVWTRWLGVLSAACGVAFLIATRSRGGWGAAAAGWGLMLAAAWWADRWSLQSRRDQPLRAPLVVAALVVAAALLIPVRGAQPLPSVATTLSLSARPLEGTGSVRLALARNTLAMIAERTLFGVGAGRWSTVYPLYHLRVVADPLFSLERQPERVENDWLEHAAELGLPAALALGLLFVAGVWHAVRQRQWALAAGLSAISLHACVSFPLHSPASAGLGMLLAGAAWRVPSTREIGRNEAADKRRRRSPATRPGVALVIALLLTIGGAALGYRVLAGQRQVNVAVLARDCEVRVAAARRVAQLTPWSRRDIGLTAAAVFQCERDPATSLAVIEPALAINPHNLNLLLLAAARQLRAGAPNRADDLARRAIEVDPQLGRAWLLLAMAQDARGDVTSASASCENALRWYRGGPEAQTYCSNRER